RVWRGAPGVVAGMDTGSPGFHESTSMPKICWVARPQVTWKRGSPERLRETTTMRRPSTGVVREEGRRAWKVGAAGTVATVRRNKRGRIRCSKRAGEKRLPHYEECRPGGLRYLGKEDFTNFSRSAWYLSAEGRSM